MVAFFLGLNVLMCIYRNVSTQKLCKFSVIEDKNLRVACYIQHISVEYTWKS